MSTATGMNTLDRAKNYLRGKPEEWLFSKAGRDGLTPKQRRRLEKKQRAAARRVEARSKPINRRCESKSCKAAPGQPCRTADGHKAKKFHQARAL